MKQHWRWLIIMLLVGGMIPATYPQDMEIKTFALLFGAPQEFTGTLVSSDDLIVVQSFRLLRGDTLYLFIQGSGDFVPGIGIYDTRLGDYVFSDATLGGTLSVQFEVSSDSNYDIYIGSMEGSGDYRIVAGINEPQVLNEAVSDTTLGSTSLNSAVTFSCATATLAERPNVEGPEERLMSPDFIVHYTTQGSNAATHEYALVVMETLQRSVQRHRELGWALPPADCGEGGDPRLDVYLMDLDEGLYGYAMPDNVIGDNPNTPEIEISAGYSHLVVENDMAGSADPVSQVKSVTAHEFHHNVQFGYDAMDHFDAIYEGGAAWFQQQLSDADDPFLSEMTFSFFQNTDVCLGGDNFEFDSFSRIYGEWVMIDSIIRDKGDLAYINLWKSLILEQGMLGFYSGLAQLNTTPQTVIQRLAVRNLLRDYASAAKFPDLTVRLEATARGAGSYSPAQSGVQPLGVDYVRLTQPGLWLFELNGRGLTLMLVGIDTDMQTATVHELGTYGAADTTGYDDVYVLVLNTTQHTDPSDCAYEDWSLRVGDGVGYLLGDISPEVWDARQFIAPK